MSLFIMFVSYTYLKLKQTSQSTEDINYIDIYLNTL